MANDISEAIWSGTFNVFAVELRCHTLEDGTRVIEAEGVRNLLDHLRPDQTVGDRGELEAFRAWQAGGGPH